MPVTLSITGNTGPEAVQELFAFLTNLHLNLNKGAQVAAEVATAKAANTNAEPEAKPEKESKKKAAKEEKAAEPKTSKFTLQEAIDRAKGIAGDGKDELVMKKLKAVNDGLGIAKVRELPPEKIDGYMAELDKCFPAKEQGSMFD